MTSKPTSSSENSSQITNTEIVLEKLVYPPLKPPDTLISPRIFYWICIKSIKFPSLLLMCKPCLIFFFSLDVGVCTRHSKLHLQLVLSYLSLGTAATVSLRQLTTVPWHRHEKSVLLTRSDRNCTVILHNALAWRRVRTFRHQLNVTLTSLLRSSLNLKYRAVGQSNCELFMWQTA